MGLDSVGRLVVEVPIEEVRDVTAGVPASHGHSFEFGAPLVALGEGADEHHPAPAQALLGGGERHVLEVGDLAHGEAFDIVEGHRGAVDERQPHQGVLELGPRRRPLRDRRRIDGVCVVLPLLLDCVDRHFT